MSLYTQYFGFAGSGLYLFDQMPFVHEQYYITPVVRDPFVYVDKVLDFQFEEIPVTLQSQYSASPNIKALTASFEELVPRAEIELYYEKIFNIYTAQGIGLDIWGRILGIGRLIQAQKDSFFGFNGSDLFGFDQMPFVHEDLTEFYEMPDYAYRKYLLITKAFSNISDSTAPVLNYVLGQIFEGQKAYVINTGVMQIRFVFDFFPDGLDLNIFKLGLLNRGAGVGYDFYAIPSAQTFGFAGSGLQGFNNGVFDVYGIENS